MSHLDISIIVPAYNEEKRIAKTLQSIDKYFAQTGKSYEILVVDDGSRDKTQLVVQSLKLSRVKIVTYDRNHGKGFAVNYGVKQASGYWILFTDADNSTPIEEFEKLFQLSDSYEVIIGSRYLRESYIAVKQAVPRIILSRLGNLLVQLLILPGIHDSQCGFKLFSASSAKRIFAKQTIWRWGFDMEILRIAKELRYKLKEVPVTWYNDDQSRLQSSRVFTSTLMELFAIKKRSLLGGYRDHSN